jgi:hypothetical protein
MKDDATSNLMTNWIGALVILLFAGLLFLMLWDKHDAKKRWDAFVIENHCEITAVASYSEVWMCDGVKYVRRTNNIVR